MHHGVPRDPELEARLGLDPEVEPDPDPLHHARPTYAHAALVAVGGALGTLARDALLHLSRANPASVPWMLCALNVAGAAALGTIVARLLDPRPHRVGLRLFLATGLLGGFTTYSSLIVAVVVLGHGGHAATAVTTLLATLLAGVLAAGVGWRLGEVER